jgi:hypothetical protein
MYFSLFGIFLVSWILSFASRHFVLWNHRITRRREIVVEFLLVGIARYLELGFLFYSVSDYEYLRFATVFSVCTYGYYEAWNRERG